MVIFATTTAVGSGDWMSLASRLIVASLVGGAIGWNRQATGKAAGLRTHMLVSLGSALFVMIPLAIGVSLSPDATSRAIQGVATGIGFLGAGEIVHQTRADARSPKIKGLTSAASVWVTAALGMTAACGLWELSLLGALITLLILGGAKWLEQFIKVHSEED